MKIGSLFSGYGGLDLACEAFFGADTAWHVEFDEAPSKILKAHWDVPNYHDVTEVDFAEVPKVDILTGGYPCQPFSAAGKRKGEDDERHLWPYVRQAIRDIRPRYTVLENVAGHRSLGFDRVLGDLAEDGMHVRWTSVRASDVGAPHHRERLFLLISDPNSEPIWQQQVFGRECEETPIDWWNSQDASNSACFGREGSGQSGASESEFTVTVGGIPALLTDADRKRSEEWGFGKSEESEVAGTDYRLGHPSPIEWGQYAPVIYRWEQLTRLAPAPTEPCPNGKPRLNVAFSEWMMGLPAGWVSDVPGLARNAQLKAIGNGVVPQQAFEAIRRIEASLLRELVRDVVALQYRTLSPCADYTRQAGVASVEEGANVPGVPRDGPGTRLAVLPRSQSKGALTWKCTQ